MACERQACKMFTKIKNGISHMVEGQTKAFVVDGSKVNFVLNGKKTLPSFDVNETVYYMRHKAAGLNECDDTWFAFMVTVGILWNAYPYQDRGMENVSIGELINEIKSGCKHVCH